MLICCSCHELKSSYHTCKNCQFTECYVCMSERLEEAQIYCVSCRAEILNDTKEDADDYDDLPYHSTTPSFLMSSDSDEDLGFLYNDDDENAFYPMQKKQKSWDSSEMKLQSFGSFSLPSYQTSQEDPIQFQMNDLVEKLGLPNLGNSCYINSIVQIFLHSTELWQALKQQFGDTNLLREVRKSYCDLMKINLWEQCDATLFLNFLLDRCSKSNSFWIQDWQSIYKCSECKKTFKGPVQKENMWILYPTSDSSSSKKIVDEVSGYSYDYDISSCMMKNLQSHEVDKKCDCCNRTTKFSCITVMRNPPKHLFINLQHFQNHRMYIYEVMEISFLKKAFTNYALKGVVQHKGSQHCGHYVVLIEDSDSWTLYDDDKVTSDYDIREVLGNQKDQKTFPVLWYVLHEEDFSDVEEDIVAKSA